ncbi:hypothetical protein B0H17DRAFT_1032660 [Mycena rosella]|uniref:Uncharacterized protein n=1 Tax=Mycena rosella TaxID=1033263 RepID=A0AAD7GXN5_MYCRO|nr:hypothetical protein B0H17DRAFT_1032660 [Mycena rosella]
MTCDFGYKSHLFFVLATSILAVGLALARHFSTPPTIPFELYLHAWCFSGFIFISEVPGVPCVRDRPRDPEREYLGLSRSAPMLPTECSCVLDRAGRLLACR